MRKGTPATRVLLRNTPDVYRTVMQAPNTCIVSAHRAAGSQAHFQIIVGVPSVSWRDVRVCQVGLQFLIADSNKFLLAQCVAVVVCMVRCPRREQRVQLVRWVGQQVLHAQAQDVTRLRMQ